MRRLRVLVGYESSGVVRESFRALGHEAYSCDLLEADDGSQFHFRCDVKDVMNDDWDLGIFHPPCTYLTKSAAWAFKDPNYAEYGPAGYHQTPKPGTLVGLARRRARTLALKEVRLLMDLPYPLAIENPSGSISTQIRKPDQTIQPYQFGDDASKATCLWFNQLPPLSETKYIKPRYVDGRPRWGNQTDSGQNRLGPSETRWKERSKTYPGIAEAMATQWSAAVLRDLEATGEAA